MSELLKLASKLRRGNLSRVERHMVADVLVLYANESTASPSPGREPGERPGSPPTAEELAELREGWARARKPSGSPIAAHYHEVVWDDERMAADLAERDARVRREALMEAARYLREDADCIGCQNPYAGDDGNATLKAAADGLRKLAEEGSDGS